MYLTYINVDVTPRHTRFLSVSDERYWLKNRGGTVSNFKPVYKFLGLLSPYFSISSSIMEHFRGEVDRTSVSCNTKTR